jgi:hypothetical protein
VNNTNNIYKFITGIFIITFIAILYVNQQALIYQMGLRIKEEQDVYSKLIDHNKIMGYNILNLRSPVKLEKRLLATQVELGMPKRWQILKLDNSLKKKIVYCSKKNLQKKNNIASVLVTDDRKTIHRNSISKVKRLSFKD